MATAKTCTVNLNNGRLVLECRQGMTLFAALRMNKIYLPTGCGARGACGQCRVRVLAGDVNAPTDNEKNKVSGADLSAGIRLGCQLRLSGDLGVEVSEHVLAAREFQTTVAGIIPLTHDIRRFSFKLAPGDRIVHRAGQFVNFMARQYADVKECAIRCFSFATPSAVENRVDIVVRRTPRGIATAYLFDHLKVGDAATIIAPFGDFYLRDTTAPCVWIAGGSGLSPFLGMLRDLIDRGAGNREVRLFFGAVNPDDLYYVEELRALAAEHLWFRYIPALSGPARCGFCSDYGLITDVVAHHLSDASGHEGYLCGSPGMIEACVRVLVEKGLGRENIFFDRFG